MLVVTAVLAVTSVIAVYFGARIAMGFGRDVRSAIFSKVETFSQVEVNNFGTGVPHHPQHQRRDQQVQTVVFVGLTMIVSAPILIVGGIIMALRHGRPAVRPPGRHPADHGARHRARHEPGDPAVPGRAGQARPHQPGHARDAVRRARHPRLRAHPARGGALRRRPTATCSGPRSRSNRLFAITIPIDDRDPQPLDGRGDVVRAPCASTSGRAEIGDLTAFLQYLSQILFAVLTAVFMFILIPRAAVSAGPDPRGPRDRARASRDPEQPVRPRRRRASAASSSSATSTSATRAPRSRSSTTSRSRPARRDDGHRRQHRAAASPRSSTSSRASTTPSGGSVLVDGVDVRDMDRERLWWRDRARARRRRSCSAGPSASNLRFGDEDATDEELWQALDDRPGHGLRRGDGRAAGGTDHARAARTCPAASVNGSRSPARWSEARPDLRLRRQLLRARLRHRCAPARRARAELGDAP